MRAHSDFACCILLQPMNKKTQNEGRGTNILHMWPSFEKTHTFHYKKNPTTTTPPPRSDLPVTSCWNPDQMSQIWKWNKQANYAAPRAPHNELLDHLWLLTLKAIELSGRTCGHISKQGGKTRAEISIPGRKQKVQIRLQLEELYNKSITTSSAAMKI